ncbi:hypothetical protein Tco_0781717 [Tanacetum coccineum]
MLTIVITSSEPRFPATPDLNFVQTPGGLPCASPSGSEVYKKLGGRWGCSVFTDMVNDGPMYYGKAKCADIGYGFLPFSFSSFGELEKDAVTLLKRIRKFSMAQDIGALAAVYIFNRISFFIANGMGAQIVSRLPSNLL